jgi:hypothetical protein
MSNYLDDFADEMQRVADRLAQDPRHFHQHLGLHLLEDRKTVVLLALREPEPVTGRTENT